MKEYKYRINGSLYNVVVNEIADEHASVEVNGTPYTVELEKKTVKKQVGSPFKKAAQAGSPSPSAVAATPVTKQSAPSSSNAQKSPLPGVILEISCNVGDSVKKGQKLLILEAMKMENVLKAQGPATVKAIKVDERTAVEKGAILIELE